LRETRIILFGLMITLMLSGTPIAECNQIRISGGIHTLDLGGVDPPTIQWSTPLNATEGVTLFWDDVYTGQTEKVWPSTNWVNDSDGIDTVIFQYMCQTDIEWMNRTPTLLQGNYTHGQYNYQFIQLVLWNNETNYAYVEGGPFKFRIFANDTLGNWRTTPANYYIGGYPFIITPTTTSTTGSQLSTILGETLWIIAIGASATITVIVFVIHRRRRGAAQ